MSKIICLQGGSANCGKSVVAVALCRAIRDKKIIIQPFKAVSILENKSIGINNAVSHLCLASKTTLTKFNNPIRVVKNGHCMGKVYFEDKFFCEIEMMNSDTPIFMGLKDSQISDIKEEIYNALMYINNRCDLIICEGASNPMDLMLFHEYDFSNYEILNLTNSNVYLVIRGFDGGNWASLLGTFFNYPQKYQKRIVGFIINDFPAIHNDYFKLQLNEIEKKLGITCDGIIPRVDYFKEIEASETVDHEEEYKIWGRIGEEFINIHKIMDNCIDLN